MLGLGCAVPHGSGPPPYPTVEVATSLPNMNGNYAASGLLTESDGSGKQVGQGWSRGVLGGVFFFSFFLFVSHHKYEGGGRTRGFI